MMHKTLLQVHDEAEKLIDLVETALAEHADNSIRSSYLHVSYKTSGALRRSSMDLTRKLADLRQNR